MTENPVNLKQKIIKKDYKVNFTAVDCLSKGSLVPVNCIHSDWGVTPMEPCHTGDS